MDAVLMVTSKDTRVGCSRQAKTGQTACTRTLVCRGLSPTGSQRLGAHHGCATRVNRNYRPMARWCTMKARTGGVGKHTQRALAQQRLATPSDPPSGYQAAVLCTRASLVTAGLDVANQSRVGGGHVSARHDEVARWFRFHNNQKGKRTPVCCHAKGKRPTSVMK